jgi:nucleotide-binding universal stress UspA family protein
MGAIVCATRGGEASRRTQERAIALAKERGRELIFLVIFDPSFAGPLNKELEAALIDEQRWLGRALLGIAQARAQEQGLDSRAEVTCGPVLETINDTLREVKAETLVIGASRPTAPSTSFELSEVYRFAQRVRQDTGVEVVVVAPDE